jgi:uncharacterized Zn-finger protein
MGVIDSPASNSGRGRGRGGRVSTSQSRNSSKSGAKSSISCSLTKGGVIQTPYVTVKQELVTNNDNNSGHTSNSSDGVLTKRKADSPDIICISETTPAKQMAVQKTTTITVAKDDDELKCTYPGCGFTAPSRDRLQFHMSAHTQSKYKCPYCAYVGNILVDIRRHILKSKKHEGLNVFQCIKCDYGSDCERTFKDHLKKYHYGLHVEESALDSILEQLFLNENNKQNISSE